MSPRLTPQSIERFRDLVAERLGLAFDDSRSSVLAGILQRRLEATGVSGEAYLRRVSAEGALGEELRQLARELTVTETYFYRSAEQIRAFVEQVLPRRLEARGAAQMVRVLSAGCASGEEPYTLAMAIRESMPEAAPRICITGVDVNPAMLEKARRARYTAWSLRDLPEGLRARWFRANGGGYSLDDGLRRTVVLQDRNLVAADAELWQPGSWDAVFCRNVLMYFEPAAARSVVACIARSLVPSGHLFLGHAETLRGLSNEFHLCHTHGTFYYRRRTGMPGPEAPEPMAPPAAGPAALPLEDAATWVEAIGRATERIGALAERSDSLVHAAGGVDAGRRHDLASALELLREERFAQGLAELDLLPRERGREPDALLLRAVLAVHGGALGQAEATCRELLQRDEMNAGAHYVLALCREGRGDAAGAMDEDRIALYLEPGFAMPRLHQGLVARRGGAVAVARRELQRALSSLMQEDASRILFFGGGFGREALLALCRAELAKCGAAP